MSLIHEALKKAQGEKRTVSPREKAPIDVRHLVTELDASQEIALQKVRARIVLKTKKIFEERRIRLGVLAGGIILFFCVNLYVFKALLREQAPASSHTPVNAKGTVETFPHNLQQIEQKKTANIVRIKDIVEQRNRDFVCTGIIYEKGASFAIINGMVVEEGARIGNGIVRRITRNKVYIMVKNKPVVIPVATSGAGTP